VSYVLFEYVKVDPTAFVSEIEDPAVRVDVVGDWYGGVAAIICALRPPGASMSPIFPIVCPTVIESPAR
jgi:hypothetical protein